MKRITLTATIDMIFIMLLTGLVMFLMSMQASAQNVGINNTTPHTKSLLDLTSSDKGLLTPRMTEAQRIAMFAAPDASAKGMLVYQTDNVQGFYVYTGMIWQMVNSNSGWGLTGNTGTNATSNFIGTGDNNDVVFKANNAEAIRIKTDGKVGIGTTTPLQQLHVNGNMNMSNDTNNIRINNVRVLSTAGTGNTFLGRNSGRNNTGTFNTFIGDSTGIANTTGSSNVGVGSNVLKSNTGGTWNTAVGSQVLTANTTGFSNTGMGIGALIKNTTGYRNTAIGGGSLQESVTAQENTALGYYTLVFNKTGHSNVAVGTYCLYSDTSGHSNTAVGRSAGYNTKGGIKNVFNGTWSGFYNTTGSFNSFSGFDAGGHNVTGERNTCIGFSSGFTNSGGNDNTFIGSNTGYATTGGMNTFLGSNSGAATVAGTNNVFLGFNSGNLNTSGSSNIAIGNNAQVGAAFTNAIAIGNNAVAGASNTMILGGSGADAVNVGIGTTTPSAKLHVTSDGFTGSQNIKMTETGTDYSRLGFYNGGTTKFWETAAYSDPVDSLSRFHIFNSSTINLFTVAGNGRIGIGNSNPTVPLSFNGNLGDKISLLQWGTGHYGFGVVAATLQMYVPSVNDDITLGYGNSSAFTERMRIKGNGYVGIGTNAPAAMLEVSGFTKLGSNAPAVKMLKLTGTTSSLQGSGTSILHGLNTAKILSVNIMVEKTAGVLIPASNTSLGDEFSFQISGTLLIVTNKASNSANILSKPFRVLITYEE